MTKKEIVGSAYITKETKKISASGEVIENDYISVGGSSLIECKKILFEVQKGE